MVLTPKWNSTHHFNPIHFRAAHHILSAVNGPSGGGRDFQLIMAAGWRIISELKLFGSCDI